MKTLLTNKQRQVVTLIIRGDAEEAKRAGVDFVPIDLDRLLEVLPYRTTKQSMQFTIRALIRNGLIFKSVYENRRGRQRVCFTATELSRRILLSAQGLSDAYIDSYDPKLHPGLEEAIKAL
jgi:hypothetical protein